MAEIKDFGEKIGGARKDLWAGRGLSSHDLTGMNAMERKTHIKKDNVWPKPDWQKLIAEGRPQGLAYWQNKMRQSIPPKPPSDDKESQDHYVEVVGKIAEAVMAVENPYEIDTFYRNVLRKNFIQDSSRSYYVSIVPEASGIITNKVLKAAQSDYNHMKAEASKKLFGVPKDEQVYVATKNRLSIHPFDSSHATLEKDRHSEDVTVLTIRSDYGRSFFYLRKEKEFADMDLWKPGTFFVMDDVARKPLRINFASIQEAEGFIESISRAAQESADKNKSEKNKDNTRNRKGAFTPPQLRKIRRTGPHYRGVRSADSDMFLKDLKFRGGEFGNWLNEADRQVSMDMAYDALRDLARLLHIRPEDVSLNESLAIAFGARGRGGSGAGAAHYEPDRQVINLTKMSGAGCLAHEWGHALDHAIGLSCGMTGFASDSAHSSSLPPAFQELLNSLKYKKVVVEGNKLDEELSSKYESAKKNLLAWISSFKPGSMSEEQASTWDNTIKTILNTASTFTGNEYFQFRRSDAIVTKPEVEVLSGICKSVTNHAIPRDKKRQICMWAREVGRYEEQIRCQEPVEKTVKTDYYKGSIEFDSLYSKTAHGYWQSSCEMFARAFDCYISDKIKASGEHSDYLSAYANCFLMPGKDGQTVYAIPTGDERTMLNEKFDRLFEELKQRDVLHDYEETAEKAVPEPPISEQQSVRATTDAVEAPRKSNKYEQMSFDEMLFSAASRASQQIPKKDSGTHDLDR